MRSTPTGKKRLAQVAGGVRPRRDVCLEPSEGWPDPGPGQTADREPAVIEARSC